MDAFYGEIRLFAFGFEPQGWMLCDGRILAVQQYQPLFAVIGFTYGGDNHTQFRIPNLLGRVAVGAGDDPQDIFDPQVAMYGGETAVTLTAYQVPPHTHTLVGAGCSPAARVNVAQGNWISGPYYIPTSGTALNARGFAPEPATATGTTLAPGTLTPFQGLSQAHENRQPYLAMGFYICFYGAEFPMRN